MDTEEELAGALAALQRRSPEELAAFIVSLLCGAPPGVQSYTEAFIAAADSSKVATLVRREISALRVGEREYDVRHRRGAEIVARAGYALGTFERVVLPSADGSVQIQCGELLVKSRRHPFVRSRRFLNMPLTG